MRPLLGVLGVATALAGGRFERWTLRVHGAVYLAIAAIVAGPARRPSTPSWREAPATGISSASPARPCGSWRWSATACS